MINALTIAYEHYLGIGFEMFTDKFISAMGLIKMLDNVKDEDVKILNNIEKNTDNDILKSLYTLDRSVNPTKGEFNVVQNKIKFTIDGEFKTYTENQLQIKLCVAIRITHEIIMSYMKNYKLERSMSRTGDGTKDNSTGVFDV